MTSFAQLFLCSLLPPVIYSCLNVKFISKTYGTIEFSQLSVKDFPSFNGRPIYHAPHHDLYLYHFVQDDEYGRWIVSISLEDHDKAIAFIDSWSITPYLTSQVGALPWTVFTNEEWVTESSLQVVCQHDESIFFDTSPQQAHALAGFYVLRSFNQDSNNNEINSNNNRPVYSFVNDHHPVSEHYMYLFWLNGKWMIGEDVGVDECLAYLASDAVSPQDINPSSLQDWYFLHEIPAFEQKNAGKEGEEVQQQQHWIRGTAPSYLISNSKESSVDNIYDTVRLHRSLKTTDNSNNQHKHQQQQLHYELSNHLFMPVMGLGTGGLHPEQTFDTIKLALKTGYRLLDLAREYKNEHVIPRVLDFIKYNSQQQQQHEPQNNSYIQRKDIFLVTKVWPTELGFIATENAILDSLATLETNYIDLYLIHWPECNPKISWMHCDTTVDVVGTWEGSWRALEKAYAEGRVGAIGVSNFNIDLLVQFAPMHNNKSNNNNGEINQNDATAAADGDGNGGNGLNDVTNTKQLNYNHLARMKVLPHVVQNWAEPGSIDQSVYLWCQEKKAVYQTYATLRNLHQLSSRRQLQIKKTLKELSMKYNTSEHAIALKLMIQKQMAVIPRASKEIHLIENLNIVVAPQSTSTATNLLAVDEINALWK